MNIIIMHWPDDPERGEEVFGKESWTEQAAMAWVGEVQAASEAGDPLLKGAHFKLTELQDPFEVQR